MATKGRLCAVAVLVSLSSAEPLFAGAFEFETVPLGDYASVIQTDGSVVLTVTSETSAGGVRVAEPLAPVVGLLGSRSVIGITPLVNPLVYDQLRFTFSVPIYSITFEFGDGSMDVDMPVEVFGYSAASDLLGVLTFPGDGSLGGALSGSFPGASYFVVSSGSLNRNFHSLGWEVADYSAAPVPEPASLGLLAVGLGIQALQRRGRARRPQEKAVTP